MAKKIQDNWITLFDLLSDGEYHDGTSMGRALNMTRSAVWKTIKKCIEYGIKIDSIKGKGYALREPFLLLHSEKIKHQLKDKNILVDVFETIDSTNDYLKKIKLTKTPRICIAEQQTKGKGRFNRSWHSPFGKNIYLSCLYPFQKDVSELAGLSLVAGLTVLKTLHFFGIKENLFVKWSNDVMFLDKKISGNLIEIQAEAHSTSQVIIGIGLNVNMEEQNVSSVSQPYASMKTILNQTFDRNTVCSVLINYLMDDMVQFNHKGFRGFIDQWAKHDCLMNQTITLKNWNETIIGKAKGVDPHGYLLLELPNGEIRPFSAGETTLNSKDKK